jgi:hypothetical protein
LGRRYDIGIRKMSEIHKALAIFGLDPGASQDAIQRRYKRLIMVWHPDRFPNEDGKKDAEEELKKINNANDVLKKHFATGHRASGCECQKPAAGAEQRAHGPGPGPGPHRKPDDAEAEAKRRDEERQKKAAAEEAARKAADQQKQQQQKGTQTTFEQAQRQQEQLKWNKIRWQIAVAEAALFIGLCIFGSAGHSAKEWWHNMTWQWEHGNDNKHDDQNTVPSPAPNPVPTPGPNPFGDPKPPPETNNPDMLPNGVMKPFDNSKVPVPNYPPQTQTQTDTTPGFNWKPVTPGSSSPYQDVAPHVEPTPGTTTTPSTLPDSFKWKPTNPSPYEQVAPKLPSGTNTTTTTSPESFDYNKYINSK